MMTTQDRIKAYLKDHKANMISMLEKMVCIQSGTKNKAGVGFVVDMIQQEMESMGFLCERILQENLGDHLIARSPCTDPEKKQILILGHMDTVFPEDTAFNTFQQDEKNIYGPGVADMKGGLVVGIYALKALLEIDMLNAHPITFVFNSDEEVGSPSSRELIKNEAKKSEATFVLEAGGLRGEVVTGRKGNISARLKIVGEAGHAAFAKKDKASAILELAHKIIKIEKLNDPVRKITANVGTVQGGIGPNTIPQHAEARIDFRFLEPEDYANLKSGMDAICKDSVIPGTQVFLEVISQRPAMPQSRKNNDLFNQLKQIADTLNIPIIAELRQGVSDANLVACEGIPVIDGLGPIGAKDHSEDEYILTRSMLDRTTLFACFLSEFLKK